jgi:hypothetical protein
VAAPQAISSDRSSARACETSARPRPMAPKEHGAWGQLGFPLVVALGLGRPSLTAIGLVLAAVGTFMAHEPLAVLFGQRGTRALRQAAGPAKRRVLALLGPSLLLGGAAVLRTTSDVRWAVAATLGLAAVAFFGFLLRGHERSTAGELWIAWTLPAAAVPVALAAEVTLPNALVAWLSFALAYGAGIYGVRGIIQRFGPGKRSNGWLGLGAVLALMLALGALSQSAAAAALWFWSIVVGCRLIRPSPNSLKRVGWILVAGSAIQAGWLMLALGSWRG